MRKGRTLTAAERPLYDHLHGLFRAGKIAGWWAYAPHEWEVESSDGTRHGFSHRSEVAAFCEGELGAPLPAEARLANTDLRASTAVADRLRGRGIKARVSRKTGDVTMTAAEVEGLLGVAA